MKRIDICGVPVSAVNLGMACEILDGWIKGRKKSYVCVAPVSTIVDSQVEAEYRKVINEADMVTPDGMPLVWMGKLRGYKDIGRTYGPDLMLALCGQGQKKGYKHFLYGGSKNTCSLLKTVLKEKFPDIDIVGEYAPPFRSDYVQEDAKVVDEINRLSPDVLWIGLGSPKQDYWMQHHRDQLDVPVMVGVGAAFDFIAGTKKQAPKWMRQVGLEWLFRLFSEPRRLWKRYLVGNTQFVYLLIKHAITARLRKKA